MSNFYKDRETELLAYANNNPEIACLLSDLDLFIEDAQMYSEEWWNILSIAHAFETFEYRIKSEAGCLYE